TSLDVRQSQSFSSDVIATTGSTPTERPQCSEDLDDADEEDLLLELRKVEILQKLKKIRKLKLSYY
ncbi:hypothetical protein N7505_007332, partial [Penicillium chrysogenum]